MNLNLFENIKRDLKSNINIENFMEDLHDFLNNSNSSKNQNNVDIERQIDNKNRKEGHLYLVTEDRNNEIYLWDFTDKPEHEFKEIISSPSLLKVAKEGSMLQYKNGEYILYSPYGYDMLYNSENDDKNQK